MQSHRCSLLHASKENQCKEVRSQAELKYVSTTRDTLTSIIMYV